MGLFDIFKGKPAPEPTSISDKLGEGQPRPHHYQFAYMALPIGLLGDPQRSIQLLNDPGLLIKIWKNLGSTLPQNQRLLSEPKLNKSDIQKIGSGKILVPIRMPIPTAKGEAVYVAFTISEAFSAGASSANPQFRYFAFSVSDGGLATLREVRDAGSPSQALKHLVPNSLESFISHIREVVQ